jgi:hypothetical protein
MGKRGFYFSCGPKKGMHLNLQYMSQWKNGIGVAEFYDMDTSSRTHLFHYVEPHCIKIRCSQKRSSLCEMSLKYISERQNTRLETALYSVYCSLTF